MMKNLLHYQHVKNDASIFNNLNMSIRIAIDCVVFLFSAQGMLWNGRQILLWNMELLKYGIEWKILLMEWKEFSILAHFNIVFILSAVNKATFDQMHQMIKKK